MEPENEQKKRGGIFQKSFGPNGGGQADRPEICAQETKITWRQVVVAVVTAAIAITVFSQSSPIYPLNLWNDANVFLTVGKSMLHGLVPYRDIYDHKGPLLHVLHALAAMISERTFLGVYFLEISAAAVFLLHSFQIVKLYKRSPSMTLIPIMAAIVYGATCFDRGDSVEELCLPFFAFAVYLDVRMARQEKAPTRCECVIVGITAAAVFWMKFTLMGFYMGWFCVMTWQFARRHEAKKTIIMLAWIMIGVAVTTLPIALYFLVNHAIMDLWTVYFYDNLFAYSLTSPEQHFILSLARNLLRGVAGRYNLLRTNAISTVATGIGLIILFRKRQRESWHCVITYLFMFLGVYIGGRAFAYYSLVFSAFLPIGVAAVGMAVQNSGLGKRFAFLRSAVVQKWAGKIVCVGFIVCSIMMSSKLHYITYKKTDLPQYQFAEIIGRKEDATLLNYGFLDGGFYTTTGIVPNCKFFCRLNMWLEEMDETQNEYVENGKVDFVVTLNVNPKLERYECIATSSFGGVEYFLYQLIS